MLVLYYTKKKIDKKKPSVIYSHNKMDNVKNNAGNSFFSAYVIWTINVSAPRQVKCHNRRNVDEWDGFCVRKIGWAQFKNFTIRSDTLEHRRVNDTHVTLYQRFWRASN